MRIASINMSIDNGEVIQRYAALEDALARLDPDVIALQEVSLGIGRPMLEEMASRAGYRMRYESAYRGQEDRQGVAILSRLPLHSRLLDLHEGGALPQLVHLQTPSGTLALANVHLSAHPKHEPRDRRRIRTLSRELGGTGTDRTLIVGDFNALPFFPSVVEARRQGYRSAYAAVHGKEPRYTFPALDADELVQGRYVKPDELRSLRRLGRLMHLAGRRDLSIAQYVIDYLFFRGIAPPIAAGLVRGDRTISDHLGLWADWRLDC